MELDLEETCCRMNARVTMEVVDDMRGVKTLLAIRLFLWMSRCKGHSYFSEYAVKPNKIDT